MAKTEKYELTEKEKKEITRLAKKAAATYDFTESARLTSAWAGDSERFMAITYGLTEALLEHSKKLGRLTWWLFFLTLILAGLTGVLIWQTSLLVNINSP